MQLAILPNFDETTALNCLLNAQQQTTQNTTTGTLVIMSPNWNGSTDSYQLAYKYGVTAPHKSEWLYINAQTGKHITSVNRQHHCDAPATGTTNYNGTVDITACFDGTEYVLRDSSRNIYTYLYSTDVWLPTGDEHLVDNDSDVWTDDPTAIDVHWGMEKTFDYFLAKHGRMGYNNANGRVNAYAHAGNFNNAQYFVGNRFTFGDGDGITRTSYTSLDIVAHEFSHAVIEHTASLNGGESGALAESLCDIFGAMVEFEYTPDSADYLIGEDVTLDIAALRSLENPNVFGHPDTYYGTYWDYAEAHSRAGVHNYWFYLLAAGGTGTNDNGLTYTVNGIGNTAAVDIVYHSLSYYLTSTASFADARMGAVEAAEDLYGEASNELIQVLNAWCAVGVGTCLTNDETIVVLQPNGGETLQAGATYTIEWENSVDISHVRLEYSINGGLSWLLIANNVATTGTINSYSWTVPDVSTPLARIRILDADALFPVDESDGLFEIAACPLVADFVACDTAPNCNIQSSFCVGIPYIFQNTSIGEPSSYTWKENSSVVGLGASYERTFDNAGIYTIELTVTNPLPFSCSKKHTKIITVEPDLNADFTYSTNGLAIDLFALDEGAGHYVWTVNGVEVGYMPVLNYVAGSMGTYDVCLVVENGCEGMQMVCKNVVVADGVDGCQSWEHFTSGHNIQAIAEDGNYIWVGTRGGLVSINKIGGETTFYNTGNSGLPDNCVKSIAVDNNGDKWVGTWYKGIAHFDGINWTVYNTSNSGLETNQTNAIAIDNNGDKWIGTITGGLAHFDGSDWTVYTTSNSGLPSNHVRSIIIDNDGNKWIGAGGLVYFDGTIWTVYNTSNSGLPSNSVKSIAIDNDGSKWIATGNGLAYFDGTNWTVYNTSNSDLNSNNLTTVVIDSNDDKWIGTWGGGLAHFNGISWTVQTTSNSDLSNDNVLSILIDNDDDKWIGTSSGLTYFDEISWIPYNTSNSGLTNSCINTITIDSNGHKWIGTEGGFAYYNDVEWGSFPAYAVHSIAIDGNGEQWVGSEVGLIHFNGINDLVAIYGTSNSGLPDNNVTSVAIDNDDNKWIGTEDGLAYFNGVGWTVYTTSNSDLPGNNITFIAIDNDDDKWIGTEDGLAYFNGVGWTVYTTSNSGLPSNHVRSIIIDNDGNKWIGAGDLVYFDGTIWTVYNTSNSGLPGTVLSIAIDNDGNKWIATGNGLAYFDGLNWMVFKTHNSNLSDDIVNSVAVDNNGNKWIGTSFCSGGCGDGLSTIFTTITSFTTPPTTTCNTTTLTFQNTSSGSNSSYTWQVNGNEVTATDDSLTYEFLTPGEYAVTLLGDNGNCSDQHTEIVSIYPVADSLSLPTTLYECSDTAIIDAGWGYAAYNWSNGDTTQTISVSESGDYMVEVTDFCGGTASATVSVLADGECVYPGDLNADGIANQSDFLYWGLYYGADGLTRPNASLTWLPQPAPQWQNYQINGANLKHIDSDGNGIIDMRDTLALAQNFGKGVSPESGSSSSDINLLVVPTGIAIVEGGYDSLYYEVSLSGIDGIVTAHGIEFSIHLDPEFIEIPDTPYVQNVYIDFTANFLGTPNSDKVQVFSRYDPATQMLHVAITRIDQVNVTGDGELCKIIIEIDDIDYNGGDVLDFTVTSSNTQLMTSNGAIVPIGGESTVFSITPTVGLHLKAYLEGAFDAGECLMNTILYEEGLLPLAQPFNRPPWNYEGTESLPSLDVLPDNAVDWVLIEARPAFDNTLIVEKQAGILLNDGSIIGLTNGCGSPLPLVHLTGESGIRFCNLVEDESYHIVVRHRNHLAVMSAEAVSVVNGVLSYDFTIGVEQAAGDNQLMELAGDKYGLYAGDFNSDGVVTVDDFNYFTAEAGTTHAYLDGDCTLDRHVTVADLNFYIAHPDLMGITQIRY